MYKRQAKSCYTIYLREENMTKDMTMMRISKDTNKKIQAIKIQHNLISAEAVLVYLLNDNKNVDADKFGIKIKKQYQ